MKCFLRSTLFLAGALVLVTLFSPGLYAQDKPVTLNFSNFLFAEAQNSVLAEQWCREVEKRTGNRLKISIVHGGKLVPGPKIYDAVANGEIDVGMSVFAYSKGKFPLTEVIDLPIGHTSGYVSTKLMNAYYEKFRPKELDGVQNMYITAHGPGVIMTKNQVSKLEDLKGVKIRATNRGHPLKGPVKRKKILIAKKRTFFLQGLSYRQWNSLFPVSASFIFIMVLARDFLASTVPWLGQWA